MGATPFKDILDLTVAEAWIKQVEMVLMLMNCPKENKGPCYIVIRAQCTIVMGNGA